MIKFLKDEKVKAFLFCLLISFFFLAIASKSSFLYHINNWTDANCFFTMGKGLLHNKIYYLDLFDQKGPLLYLYHTLGAIISYKSFIGVYFIEVISFSFFLYYAYQLLCMFIKKNTAYYCLPIISFIILTLPAFTHGDSAEEFCLPFLMFGLYQLVKFLKEKQEVPSYKFLFIQGIIAGLVFTIKYTLLGFWFAFMMCIFFYLLKKAKVKRAFVSCFIFLLGMSIPILPWIIYFFLHQALDDFIFSYFTFNITLYPMKGSFVSHLILAFSKLFKFMTQNLGVGIPFFIGMVALCLDKKFFRKEKSTIILLTCFLFLCFGVLLGGVSFRYYYLIFTPFMIFGFAFFSTWVERYYQINKYLTNKFILCGFTLVMFAFTFFGSKNVLSMKWFVPKEKLVQYQFAEIINKKKNPTLLNYHFLDGGFYTVTGILPTNKYFQKQNLPDKIFPDIIKEQNSIIKNSQVDFVVTRRKISSYDGFKFSPYLAKNYHEVARKNENYEEKRFQYILWEKNQEI